MEGKEEEDSGGCGHFGVAQRQKDPDDGFRRGRASPRPQGTEKRSEKVGPGTGKELLCSF